MMAPSAGWRVACIATVIAAAAVACESTDRPTEPAWGRQPCGHCGMIVGDARTAAELVTARRERVYFDDIGCMVVYEHEHQAEGAPLHAWVHDSDGPGWLDAERARYTSGEHTPMDFGYVAHAGTGSSLEEMRRDVLGRLSAGREQP